MLLLIMDLADTAEDKHKVELLYDKYQRMMYCIAYKILNHHEDTEDVLMEAWEKVIRNLNKISEVDCHQTKAFIVTIVERTAIDYYRRIKKLKNSETSMQIDEFDYLPVYATKDKNMEDFELLEFFRNLPKMYAEVLILYYMNQLSVTEISKLTGLSVSNVKKRLERGRDIIRRELGYER